MSSGTAAERRQGCWDRRQRRGWTPMHRAWSGADLRQAEASRSRLAVGGRSQRELMALSLPSNDFLGGLPPCRQSFAPFEPVLRDLLEAARWYVLFLPGGFVLQQVGNVEGQTDIHLLVLCAANWVMVQRDGHYHRCGKPP